MLRINSTTAVDEARLADFCRRWKIRQLAVFGSARRPDFRPDSDIVFLVTFSPGADWSLFDHVTMESELSGMRDKLLVTGPDLTPTRQDTVQLYGTTFVRHEVRDACADGAVGSQGRP